MKCKTIIYTNEALICQDNFIKYNQIFSMELIEKKEIITTKIIKGTSTTDFEFDDEIYVYYNLSIETYINNIFDTIVLENVNVEEYDKVINEAKKNKCDITSKEWTKRK